MTTKIVAVIVAYQPAAGQLGRTIAAIASQVDEIIVVCNSAVDDSHIPMMPGARLERIQNPTNVGLAAAQNVGLRRCASSTNGSSAAGASVRHMQPYSRTPIQENIHT